MTFKAPRPDQITRIISHRSCADGFASALILRACYPDARVEFIQHETPSQRELDPSDGCAIFCDITPHESNAQAFADAGHYCLDHHKTQKHIVEMFGDRGVFAEEGERTSGAGLAFKVFEQRMPLYERKEELRDFTELACIYDTWVRDSPRWKEASEQAGYLHFLGQERAMARKSIALTKEEKMFARVLSERHLENAKKAYEERILPIGNFGVFADDEEGRLINEVADHAREVGSNYTAIIGFQTKPQDEITLRYKFSVRRVDPTYDCSKATRFFGGGGHSGAGGFSSETDYDLSGFDFVARYYEGFYEGTKG